MTDVDLHPGAKLPKQVNGDAVKAAIPQALLQTVTPDLPEPSGTTEQAVDKQTNAGAMQKTVATAMQGGKKRKVALYVSYIGAGYHVSTFTSP